MNVYIGTYSDTGDKNIFLVQVDLLDQEGSGRSLIQMKLQEGFFGGKNPSCLYLSPKKQSLYAVNELSEENDGSCGRVVCLKKKNGVYDICNSLSTEGNHPCHVIIEERRNLIFVSNYTSGSLSVFKLKANGELDKLIQKYEYRGHGVHPERQENPHTHQSILSNCGNYLFVSDLGCDCIYQYKILDGTKPLSLMGSTVLPPGTGPRHMVFSEDYNFLYAGGELDSSIVRMEISSTDKRINYIDSVKIFPDEDSPYPRTSVSEIACCRNYIFIANRGDDTISIFQRKHNGGLLFVKHVSAFGHIPRHIAVRNIGHRGFLLMAANQESHNLRAIILNKNLELVDKNHLDIKAPSWITFGD